MFNLLHKFYLFLFLGTLIIMIQRFKKSKTFLSANYYYKSFRDKKINDHLVLFILYQYS